MSSHKNPSGRPNHLIDEKSPYLLQHAYNPIDWYPWCDAAFSKAISEGKPIFLSIGYSACHWCHVMGSESFEDNTVAELMNKHFVAIKVDREERPDIDSIYMTVAQAMTGSGGWPLTIIMTPDKKPFFAGTYFSKDAKYGRPGLMDILSEVHRLWVDDRQKLIESGEQMTAALQDVAVYNPVDAITENDLGKAYRTFIMRFDGVYGGFGNAPKFPSPHNLMFLLRWWKRTGESDALVMVERTLQKMYYGGIHDHIGGGFHRYSTDPVWLVPHFEKMLYDQAMLAMAYTEAYQATRNELYADAANDIFTYVLRDMTSSEGGFYSAEDADSEGAEGKFYIWTTEEVREILNSDEAAVVIRAYGLAEPGNFEGANILFRAQFITKPTGDNKLAAMGFLGVQKVLENARAKLLAVRETRERPFRDDKILTDWNGLMIAALAKAARVLGRPEYASAASKAVSFIRERMHRDDGRLLHRYRDGEAAITGYADDYAFLAWGLLELYEATFDAGYLSEAIKLTDEVLSLFWDSTVGGLYLTANDAEELIMRTKDIYDGAIPSGNSVAATNLMRLSHITGSSIYDNKGRAILKTFGEAIIASPMGFAQSLSAADYALGPSMEIVIAGDLNDKTTRAMVEYINSKYLPNAVVVHHPDGADASAIEKLAPNIKEQNTIGGQPAVYVCQNYTCKAPVTDVGSLKLLLD